MYQPPPAVYQPPPAPATAYQPPPAPQAPALTSPAPTLQVPLPPGPVLRRSEMAAGRGQTSKYDDFVQQVYYTEPAYLDEPPVGIYLQQI